MEGKTITRQYTPVSDQDCQGHFDVLIKVFLFWNFHILYCTLQTVLIIFWGKTGCQNSPQVIVLMIKQFVQEDKLINLSACTRGFLCVIGDGIGQASF